MPAISAEILHFRALGKIFYPIISQCEKIKTGLTENVAEEHSTGDPAAGKIIFLPIYFVIRKIRKDCNTNMITRENIHTLGDLLE
ncbi:MAG: hypothetical protein Q4C16_05395, partial [Eubacteriales bacterium]|nr:hypothetical protein [Eubacteriales bacterium]